MCQIVIGEVIGRTTFLTTIPLSTRPLASHLQDFFCFSEEQEEREIGVMEEPADVEIENRRLNGNSRKPGYLKDFVSQSILLFEVIFQ